MTEAPLADRPDKDGAAPRLVLATHNKGKLRELRELLRGQVPGLDVDTQVVDAGAVGAPDVAETGVTFAENSLLKARAVAEATGLVAIADDSGLAVDVLGGAPGIFSARWSGRHGDDAANLQLLLAQLADVPDEYRGAAFVCAAALAVPGPRPTAAGKWWSTGSWKACCCGSRAGRAASATTPSCSRAGWTAAAPSSAPRRRTPSATGAMRSGRSCRPSSRPWPGGSRCRPRYLSTAAAADPV